MKEDVRKRWVAALRSGDYRQSRHYLRSSDGFCANGVLCDLFLKDAGEDWTIGPSNAGGNYCIREMAYLVPNEVLDWAGIAREGDPLPPNKIADLNDTGTPFSELADIIEAGL